MATKDSSSLASTNPTLSRKLRKVLEARTDSHDLLAALQALSEFYSRNNIATRRTLRADVERRGLEITCNFMEALRGVQDQLDCVQGDVVELKESCQAIGRRLGEARSTTQQLMRETQQLTQKHHETIVEARIVEAFLDRFQLSHEEVCALKMEPLTDAFFDVLKRIQGIQTDCRTLLQTQHQRAGLEILDSMTMFQETAYERLFRWVQNEIQGLYDDHVEVRVLLCRAIRALRDRPVLFKHCTDEVARYRRDSLLLRFLNALTRGGPGGMPRPIEVHAHDPLRYVSDMLAWIHQAMASERELLISLFGTVSGDEDKVNDADVQLDSIFEVLVTPFHARIDQVLQSQPGLVLSYRLANMLEFYTHTMGGLLGTNGALTEMLDECRLSAVKVFFALVKAQADKLRHFPPAYPADLSPPHAILEALNRLGDILSTYSTSLTPPEQREIHFSPVLEALLTPLLDMCETTASGLDTSDRAVFMLNNLNAAHRVLLSYDFTVTWVQRLASLLGEEMDRLVQDQASTFLKRCDLSNKLALLQETPQEAKLSDVPGMDVASLTASFRGFYHSLFSLGAFNIPQCDRISGHRLRSQARRGVAQLISSAYDKIFAAVNDPKNGYQDPSSIAVHSPEQIRMLLDVEETSI